MIVWKCILCVYLYVEDCEIVEALKRLVRENHCVFVCVMLEALRRLVRENPGVFGYCNSFVA